MLDCVTKFIKSIKMNSYLHSPGLLIGQRIPKDETVQQNIFSRRRASPALLFRPVLGQSIPARSQFCRIPSSAQSIIFHHLQRLRPDRNGWSSLLSLSQEAQQFLDPFRQRYNNINSNSLTDDELRVIVQKFLLVLREVKYCLQSMH